ncbi:glycosyltransferase [Psychromarinibacter sp. S121]|uniref:glycosyltransferase n=1 Tax=Psychromarinibacter sp. S121 TaxID=3415127 RepID=UPI003C7E26F5
MPSDPGFAAGLTVAISTLGARADGIVLPPPEPSIFYDILVQRPGAASSLEGPNAGPDTRLGAGRDDVRVLPLQGQGVAASRNAALDAARTPYLLFGDDDVTLDLAGVRRLWAVLRDDPALAVVTGRRTGPVPARYAGQGHPLRLWNAAKTATPEILLRVAPVRAAGVRFDTGFGIGAPHPLGDEYVFLADALKVGLKGWFAPIVIGHHPAESTGADWSDPVLLRARMAVLRRVFGPLAGPMRLAFALKNRRRLRGAPGGVLGFALGRVPDR